MSTSGSVMFSRRANDGCSLLFCNSEWILGSLHLPAFSTFSFRKLADESLVDAGHKCKRLGSKKLRQYDRNFICSTKLFFADTIEGFRPHELNYNSNFHDARGGRARRLTHDCIIWTSRNLVAINLQISMKTKSAPWRSKHRERNLLLPFGNKCLTKE